MRARSSSVPSKRPPSHVGRHVTTAGTRRPCSAPATSRSLTPSRRSSTMSPCVASSRATTSSAMVRPVTVSQSNAVVITNKNASPTGRLKRRLGLAELLACGQTLGSRPFSYRPVPPPIAGGNREHEGAKRMPHLDRIQRLTVLQPLGRCQRRQGRDPSSFKYLSVSSSLSPRMNILRGAVVVAFLLAVAAGLPAQSRTFPVDEVKPGMVGIGRTVFEGDRLEEFKVHVIGVL